MGKFKTKHGTPDCTKKENSCEVICLPKEKWDCIEKKQGNHVFNDVSSLVDESCDKLKAALDRLKMNLGNFKREALPGFFKDEDIQPTQKMMNSAQKYLSDMKNETTKFSNQRNNKNPIGGVEISHTSDCSDDGNIKEYKDFAKTTNAAVASIKAGCSLQYAIITNCVKTLQEQNIIACAVDQGALHSLKVRSYGEKLQAKNQRTFIDWYDTTEKKMTAMWDDFLKAITNLNNFFAELKKKYGQNISNISATKI